MPVLSSARARRMRSLRWGLLLGGVLVATASLAAAPIRPVQSPAEREVTLKAFHRLQELGPALKASLSNDATRAAITKTISTAATATHTQVRYYTLGPHAKDGTSLLVWDRLSDAQCATIATEITAHPQDGVSIDSLGGQPPVCRADWANAHKVFVRVIRI